jgi:hypothetical protein
MTAVQAVLVNYGKLCAYCDSFFSVIRKVYKAEMACRKGCCACCELHSVCAIEARVLVEYLAGRPPRAAEKRKKNGACALAFRGTCRAYPARPVICRTHGVAISIDKGSAVLSSCNLNFAGPALAALPQKHVLDTTKITSNLMRLNHAFCMAVGDPALSPRRFTMEQVLAGQVPKRILETDG